MVRENRKYKECVNLPELLSKGYLSPSKSVGRLQNLNVAYVSITIDKKGKYEAQRVFKYIMELGVAKIAYGLSPSFALRQYSRTPLDSDNESNSGIEGDKPISKLKEPKQKR
ncbi:hypothetical protein Tco_0158114 [Tanacetum coccineum]